MSQQPSRAPEPVGAYPYTRRAGNLLFLSGVGPRQRGQNGIPGVEVDEDGNVLRYDFESQSTPCFRTCATFWKKPARAGTTWWT